MANTLKTIFDYISDRETAYATGIPLGDSWDWSMKTHLQESFLYKNGQLLSGKNKGSINEKPVKNIIPPILNVRYQAEDIDVKNIELYVDDPEKHHLSFLVKKYHDDVYVVENDIDSFLDDIKEEKIDMGGTIIMDIGQAKPLQMNLLDIAFCDQRDILSSPIGFKYNYSPSDLQEMKDRKWGDKNYGADITIDELILLAKTQISEDGKKVGDNIDVYLILGYLPESYLNDGDEDKYVYQQQVVGYYQTKDGKKGITLFKIETENPLKRMIQDKIRGRALGVGGVEALFEPYIWTNYSEIRKKEFLDAASKIALLTDDGTISAKHPSGLKGMDNLELIETKEGRRGIWQADTFPRNFQLFDKVVEEWWIFAQTTGFSHDPMMGIEAKAGTPFRAQERQVIEGKSVHKYRQGKFAKFIEEVYKDWILPYIATQIIKDQKWLSELSLDELQSIAENVSQQEINNKVKKVILSGGIVDPQEIDILKQKAKEQFLRGGNRRFIQILKDELKDIKLRVKVTVGNKQKDLGRMSEILVDIFNRIFANPQGFQQTMAIPGAAKAFNQILEYAGLSSIDFNFMPKELTTPQAPQQMAQAPQQMTQAPMLQSPQGQQINAIP